MMAMLVIIVWVTWPMSLTQGFVPVPPIGNKKAPHNNLFPSTTLQSSPLDGFLNNIFGKPDSGDGNNDSGNNCSDESTNNDDSDLSISSFQQELAKRDEDGVLSLEDDDSKNKEDESSSFDGYDFRDAIYEKWGECFDVDFQRVDSYGFRNVYLNILPFRLGGRRFRHQTEFDYLCHLQAVVEILVKYNQLDYVLAQLYETSKKPRAGTSPLVAVPLRLDLTPEQVDKILG